MRTKNNVNTIMTPNNGASLRLLLDVAGEPQRQIELIGYAVLLARQMGLRLEGLLIPHSALIKAAEIPFVSEIFLAGGEERPYSARQLRQDIDAASRIFRREFEKIALREQFPSRFEVIDSDRGTWIEQEGFASEILMIYQSRMGHSLFGSRGGIRSATVNRIVSLVYSGDEASQRALAIGIALAESTSGGLNVILLESEQQHADALRAEVREQVKQRLPLNQLAVPCVSLGKTKAILPYLVDYLITASRTRLLILPHTIIQRMAGSEAEPPDKKDQSDQGQQRALLDSEQGVLYRLLEKLEMPLILVR